MIEPEEPPPSAPEGSERRERDMARAVGVISAATFLSRLLGLVREQVFAILFGAGFAVDAFQVAFRIPNLLRDLFAEGAMSAAFVPTLTRTEKERGRDAAVRLANLVLHLLLVGVGAICIVVALLAPWIVRIMAPGFESVPGKLELTALMTRIMAPFLLLIALAAAVMGFLNTRRVYFVPAVAPSMLNIGLILSGFVIAPICPRFGLEPIVGMAIGAMLGGLGQLAIQLPALGAVGFRWLPVISFRDRDVLRMVGLMAPAAVGIAAVQINVFASTFLASLLEQGSVSWLNYAYRLMQLPIGLFGIAIATVTLTEVSRHAAANRGAELRATLAYSLRLLFVLTFPATLLLITLAEPIVALLYQHGRFLASDTAQTTRALWGYAAGLAAFSGVRVLVPAFYSLGLSRIPVVVSFVTIGSTVALYFVLMGPLRHAGLALATSIGSILNFAILFVMFRRRVGPLGGAALAGSAGRILAAALGASAAAWAGARMVDSLLGAHTLVARIAAVGAGLTAAGIVYLILGRIMRIGEIDTILGWITGRRGANGPPGPGAAAPGSGRTTEPGPPGPPDSGSRGLE